MNVRKRGESYQIRVWDGSRRKSETMTYRSPEGLSSTQKKRAVEKVARDFEERVKSGALSTKIKFAAFLDKWYDEYAEKQLKARTLKLYRDMGRRVNDYFGELYMESITPVHILEFVNSLSRGVQGVPNKAGQMTRKQSCDPLSPKTVKNYLMFLSSVFNSAVDWGYIESNPASKVKAPRQAKPKVECLSPDQVAVFLETLESRPLEEKVIFYTLLFTGIRRGELLGLEWQDINFSAQTLSIRRTSQYTPGRGIFTDTPKTEGSARTIKVSPVLLDLLSEYKKGRENKEGRLFTKADGSPMHPNSPYKMLKRILSKTDLPDVSIHSLTFAVPFQRQSCVQAQARLHAP